MHHPSKSTAYTPLPPAGRYEKAQPPTPDWLDQLGRMRINPDDPVTYEETPTFGLVHRLASQGYHTDIDGLDRPRFVGDSEFIYLRRRLPKRVVLDRIYGRRALNMGTLFLHSSRGASIRNRWVLEINGKDNVTSLTKAIGPLANEHQVDLDARVVAEKANIIDDDWDF